MVGSQFSVVVVVVVSVSRVSLIKNVSSPRSNRGCRSGIRQTIVSQKEKELIASFENKILLHFSYLFSLIIAKE